MSEPLAERHMAQQCWDQQLEVIEEQVEQMYEEQRETTTVVVKASASSPYRLKHRESTSKTNPSHPSQHAQTGENYR